MTTKTWAIAAGVLLLLASAVWTARRDVAPEPTERAAAARGVDARDAAPGAKAIRGPRAERREEGAVSGVPLVTPGAPPATAKLRIHVRRADGVSPSGTRVFAWHEDVVDGSGAAGADGVAELPTSDVARRAVVAATGHPLAWTTIPAGASEQEVVVPADASVEGIVRVDGLAPRESVELTLSLADGLPWVPSDALPPAVSARLGAGRGLWTTDVPAQTDADGRFAFTGVAPGRDVHVVIPQGFVFRDSTAHPYRFVETGVPAQGLFLDLLALPRFSGRVVTSDATPIENAVVVLTGAHVTGGFSSQTKPGPDGRFVVCAPFLDPKSLALTVTDADGKAERRILLDVAGGASHELGDVRLADVRTVAVRVRDIDGRPVPGAIAVEAHKVVSDAPTDADGRATLRLWDDPPRARIGASGFVPASLDLSVPAAGPIDVVLSRAAVLEVKLNGDPSPGLASFRLDLASPGAMFESPGGTYDEISSLAGGATAVAEGSPDGHAARIRLAARGRSFLVSGLRAASPIRLRLLDDIGTVHADLEIALAAGERRVLALDVPASRPFGGAVIDAAGRPIVNACVQASQSGPEDEWITANGAPTLTDGDGRFAVDDVRSGHLRVTVSAAGHPVWRREDVDVPASGRDLVVRLESARTLRVTLRDENGAPVEDAAIHVERTAPGADGAIASSRRSGNGRDGTWSFDDCPTGAVVAVVQVAEGPILRLPVAEGADDVTLTVHAGK